jgi:hypothetical protein
VNGESVTLTVMRGEDSGASRGQYSNWYSIWKRPIEDYARFRCLPEHEHNN